MITSNRAQFAPSDSNGEDRTSVKVGKEAILAAGAVHSPQILQVSGIGDPELMADIGIESVVDLPAVGQNFQDHLFVRTDYSSK
jgi:choline dehydrogenase-like flavoprotein